MKDQSQRVRIYRRVSKHGKSDKGFQQLGEEEKLFIRPTLLCCGGVNINKKIADPETGQLNGDKRANGFAKVGHALLGYKERITPEDPVDIVSVVYPGSADDLSQNAAQLNRRTFKNKKATFSKPADNFFYDYIEPLIVDEQKNPREIETIKHNLRNIHILAHSYGAVFVRQVGNALCARLKELEFDDEEIKDATAQVLVVTAGSTAPLAGGKASFTTLDILNSEDKISGQHYPGEELQDTMIQDLLKKNDRLDAMEKSRPANPLNVMPVRLSLSPQIKLEHSPGSRRCLLYSSSPLIYKDEDKRGMPIEQDKDILRSNACGFFYDNETDAIPVVSVDETNHEVQHYFHLAAGSNGFMLRTAASSVLANGINNAIENNTHKEKDFTPLPSPMKLLKCPKKLFYPLAEDKHVSIDDNKKIQTKQLARDFTKIAHIIGYNERIEAACGGIPR